MNLPKPFNEGVWIITSIGGDCVIAQVDDLNADDQALRKELFDNKCLCVTLQKKYIVSTVSFPMQARGTNGQAGFTTANIVQVMKYERSLECFNEFPTHCVLTTVSFVMDLDPEDIKVIATTVNNGEQAAEMEKRANKSNIQLVKG